MLLVPIRQNVVGRLSQSRVVFGQSGIDHRQFMGVGANRFKFACHRDLAIGSTGKGPFKPFLHRLHTPVLPQVAVPPPRTEVGNGEIRYIAQRFDLLPDTRHRACVEDLQLEPAHFMENRSASQFHQYGEGRNFPKHDFGPATDECQLILIAFAFQLIRRQTQLLEPFHKVRPEHLSLAVKRVAAQPCALAT